MPYIACIPRVVRGESERVAAGVLGKSERVAAGVRGESERAAVGVLGESERVAAGVLGKSERAAAGVLGECCCIRQKAHACKKHRQTRLGSLPESKCGPLDPHVAPVHAGWRAVKVCRVCMQAGVLSRCVGCACRLACCEGWRAVEVCRVCMQACVLSRRACCRGVSGVHAGWRAVE
eukprot:352664-Chlamydomonas_euryale.AAC.1